jgi:hypothetical protein
MRASDPLGTGLGQLHPAALLEELDGHLVERGGVLDEQFHRRRRLRRGRGGGRLRRRGRVGRRGRQRPARDPLREPLVQPTV